MSDFFEMIDKRESCRDFSDRKPTKEQLVRCVEAARLAPSACNSQPWHFTVVNGGESSQKTAQAIQKLGMNKFTDNCHSFIVISETNATLAAKFGGLIENQHYAATDIGIAAAHIIFAAEEQGLSTCVLGWFDEKKLIESLEIKNIRRVRLVIAVGYSAGGQLRPKKRRDINDIMDYCE